MVMPVTPLRMIAASTDSTLCQRRRVVREFRVMALMQRYGIRCVDRGESLALEFPLHKEDTASQYRELVVHCSPTSRLVRVSIGAWDRNSDRLAISVYDEAEREKGGVEVNYFETNTRGEIIGHSKNMVDHEGNLEAHMMMHRTGGWPE